MAIDSPCALQATEYLYYAARGIFHALSSRVDTESFGKFDEKDFDGRGVRKSLPIAVSQITSTREVHITEI